MHASRRQRSQLMLAGVVMVAVIVAAVVVIVISGSGGKPLTQQQQTGKSRAVSALLAGIPQSGTTLGSASAPVTITEFGDLVCPICDDYALGTEQQLISAEVRTGKVKLVWRAAYTASSYANASGYTPSQVAIRSAGLQDKGWNYILLTYEVQPTVINGQDAEDVPYVTTSYLQNIAEHIPGLNLVKWQSNMTNTTLIAAVNADTNAAKTDAPRGTPTIIVSGSKGAVTYDQSGSEPSAIPTLAQLQALIAQVS